MIRFTIWNLFTFAGLPSKAHDSRLLAGEHPHAKFQGWDVKMSNIISSNITDFLEKLKFVDFGENFPDLVYYSNFDKMEFLMAAWYAGCTFYTSIPKAY